MNLNELEDAEFKTTVRRDRIVVTGESHIEKDDQEEVDVDDQDYREDREILNILS